MEAHREGVLGEGLPEEACTEEGASLGGPPPPRRPAGGRRVRTLERPMRRGWSMTSGRLRTRPLTSSWSVIGRAEDQLTLRETPARSNGVTHFKALKRT